MPNYYRSLKYLLKNNVLGVVIVVFLVNSEIRMHLETSDISFYNFQKEYTTLRIVLHFLYLCLLQIEKSPKKVRL